MTQEENGRSTSTPAAGAAGDIADRLMKQINKYASLRSGGMVAGIEETLLRHAYEEIVSLRERREVISLDLSLLTDSNLADLLEQVENEVANRATAI